MSFHQKWNQGGRNMYHGQHMKQSGNQYQNQDHPLQGRSHGTPMVYLVHPPFPFLVNGQTRVIAPIIKTGEINIMDVGKLIEDLRQEIGIEIKILEREEEIPHTRDLLNTREKALPTNTNRRQDTCERAGVQCLKSLHPNLYIPSDFVNVNFDWQKTFSLEKSHKPRKCQFHIMPKEAQFSDQERQAVLLNADSDYAWTVKVMLLSIPSMDDLYESCCSLTGGDSDRFQHQSRLYKFLVGSKGKREVMAIGGAWSSSLDGPDPGSNPTTLIYTAIRTCKALTGIDLSECTNWRRMVEIQYHRDEEVRKGNTIPARVETTVIFLPDVHSCMPTVDEYSDLRKSYLDTSEAVIEEAEQKLKMEAERAKAAAESTVADASNTTDQKVEGEVSESLNASVESANNESMTEQMDTTDGGEKKEINVKGLKVSELRKELESRGLSSRGLKNALVERLTEALEEEAKAKEDAKANGDQENEESTTVEQEADTKGENDDAEGKEKSADEATPSSEEKPSEEAAEKEEDITPQVDKEKIRALWTLPDSVPKIPVHPDAEYKKGSFECVTIPLSSLLNYKQEDNRESIFEVSLFAESFKQMLQRDHALNIYQAICKPLPDLTKNETEESDDKEEKAEDEKKDSDVPDAKRIKVESETDDKETEKSENASKEVNGDDKTADEREEAEAANDTSTDDKKEAEDVKVTASVKKVEEKMVTLRKDLLLSFVFFDTTQCGYIKSSDLTDIIHSIGLGLSRSQIKKLLSPLLENDDLKYRKLTDVPERLLEQYRDIVEKLPCTGLNDVPTWNMAHILKSTVTNQVSEPTGKGDGIVTYNGAVIDVKSLQTRLEKNESTMADMETTIEKLNRKLASVTSELDKTKEEKGSLESEHEEVKKKLTTTEGELRSTSTTKSRYEKTLKNIAQTISEMLPKKKEPEEEK